MNQLRIIDNLNNIIEKNHVAMKGNLVCNCGCERFLIFHTGKQTKGILSPYVIKHNGQIVIQARCSDCGSVITILDTNIDGRNPHKTEQIELKQFLLNNNIDTFTIVLYYNFYPEYFKTNLFEECFIKINNETFKKSKILYEG